MSSIARSLLAMVTRPCSTCCAKSRHDSAVFGKLPPELKIKILKYLPLADVDAFIIHALKQVSQPSLADRHILKLSMTTKETIASVDQVVLIRRFQELQNILRNI